MSIKDEPDDLTVIAARVHYRGYGKAEPEYYFAKPRRWRFDLAWPELMVAFEREGGSWGSSRHTSGSGYAKDCEKYNRAAQLGWRVFRFTGDMIRDGRAFAMMSDVLIPF